MAITLSPTKLVGLLWTLTFLYFQVNVANSGKRVLCQGLTQGAKYRRFTSYLSLTEIQCNAYTDSYLPLVMIAFNDFLLVKHANYLVIFSFSIHISLMCLSAQGAMGWSASTIWLGIIRRNRYLGIAREQAPSRVLPADAPPASPISILSQYFN